jgi:collagen type VII alpha
MKHPKFVARTLAAASCLSFGAAGLVAGLSPPASAGGTGHEGSTTSSSVSDNSSSSTEHSTSTEHSGTTESGGVGGNGSNGGNTGTCPSGSTAFKVDSASDWSKANLHFDVSEHGQLLAWTDGNTGPYDVVRVLVKGGRATAQFDYAVSASGAVGLTAPINASGGPAGISHYTVCFVGHESGGGGATTTMPGATTTVQGVTTTAGTPGTTNHGSNGGNTGTCPSGSTAFKVDGAINWTNANLSFVVSEHGQLLAWTDGNTGPLDVVRVLVKGGRATAQYDYAVSATGAVGLTAPINASGGPAGISHYTVCFVAHEGGGATTTMPAVTTTMPAVTTTQPGVTTTEGEHEEACASGSTEVKVTSAVNFTLSNLVFVVSGEAKLLAWTDNNAGAFDVVRVIVKGGATAAVYNYDTNVSGGVELMAAGGVTITGYTICYVAHEGETTTTGVGVTTTSGGSTTTAATTSTTMPETTTTGVGVTTTSGGVTTTTPTTTPSTTTATTAPSTTTTVPVTTTAASTSTSGVAGTVVSGGSTTTAAGTTSTSGVAGTAVSGGSTTTAKAGVGGTSASGGTTASSGVAGTSVSGGTLPSTGSSSLPMALVALGILLMGGALIMTSRTWPKAENS